MINEYRLSHNVDEVLGTHKGGRTAQPANTRLLIRRVALDPAQVSADPRSRRRRTLHPDQRDMLFPELAQQPAVYAYRSS